MKIVVLFALWLNMQKAISARKNEYHLHLYSFRITSDMVLKVNVCMSFK